MTTEQLPYLAAAILVIAFLYSSVGHAGASGYIAVLSLAGLSQAEIKPTALAMNILVASITTWQFWRAGHFSWKLFWPFALLAIPLAFVGGSLTLDTVVHKVLIGVILLYSAARLLISPRSDGELREPSLPVAIMVGGVIGLLSGLTGTGGGIFLTPVLLFMRWSAAKTAGAVSALFILVNSISGLLGYLSSTRNFPLPALGLLVAAVIGGTLGSYLGSQRLSAVAIKRMLAIVLITAGFKLILSR